MKSTGFHEICRISWILDFLAHLGFFFRTNTDIQYYMLNRQEISWSTTECCIFHQNQSPWHEIHQISWPWNLPDFMNTRFFFRTNTDIQYQNQYRYTLWAYYMLNMQCISPCHEIRWISPWNLPDFMVYHWMLYFSSEPIQIYIV